MHWSITGLIHSPVWESAHSFTRNNLTQAKNCGTSTSSQRRHLCVYKEWLKAHYGSEQPWIEMEGLGHSLIRSLAPLHCVSKPGGFETSNPILSHQLDSEWMSRRENEWAQQSARVKRAVMVMCKWVVQTNRWASGPVLTSHSLVACVHSFSALLASLACSAAPIPMLAHSLNPGLEGKCTTKRLNTMLFWPIVERTLIFLSRHTSSVCSTLD